VVRQINSWLRDVGSSSSSSSGFYTGRPRWVVEVARLRWVTDSLHWVNVRATCMQADCSSTAHCSMFIQLHVSQLSEYITSRRFSLGGYACLRFVTNCIAVVIAPPPEYCDDRVCLSVCPRVRVYLFRNYTCNLRHFCSCYLWLLLGPPLPCTSGFMDGVVVMFAHDSRRERTYTQSYSPGGSTDLTPRRIFKLTHPARTGRSLLSTIALFVKRTRVQFKMSQVWVFTKSLCCTVGFTRSFPRKWIPIGDLDPRREHMVH